MCLNGNHFANQLCIKVSSCIKVSVVYQGIKVSRFAWYSCMPVCRFASMLGMLGMLVYPFVYLTFSRANAKWLVSPLCESWLSRFEQSDLSGHFANLDFLGTTKWFVRSLCESWLSRFKQSDLSGHFAQSNGSKYGNIKETTKVWRYMKYEIYTSNNKLIETYIYK